DIMSQELIERNQALQHSLSTLRATLESTADGILVVNNDRSIESYNRKFHEMWRIPQELIDRWDDHQAIAFVLDQVKDPVRFVETIERLSDSEEEHYDLLEFKDERVFERFSQPRRVAGT